MPAVAILENFNQESAVLPNSSGCCQDWDNLPDDHWHHRKEKNRNAARKSRRKQTEKADLLHEELQSLERSNAAYVKEIAELKKEIEIYTTALENHEPCRLTTQSSGASVHPGVPEAPSTDTPSTSVFDPYLFPDFGFTDASSSSSCELKSFFESAICDLNFD